MQLRRLNLFYTPLLAVVFSMAIGNVQAADGHLKGVIIASRDITVPQLGPVPESTQDLAECEHAYTTSTQQPVALEALTSEAAVKAYREKLKAKGNVVAEPTLAKLDTVALNRGISSLIGQPLNAAQISKITALLLDAVNVEGAMLADIYVPPQKSDDGYVVAVVSPAKVGKIITEGQEHFDGDRLACEIRNRPGAQLNLRTLAEDLQWLNRTPWRVTDVSYTPGENPQEADILLATQDRSLFRPYLSFDNTGTRVTGQGRQKLGFSWGNPFGLFDHRLDYAYTKSNLADALNSHTLGYSMPTNERYNLNFSLAYATNDIQLFGGDFVSKGKNIQASVSANKVLAAPKKYPNLLHEATLGLDFKRIGSSLAFGQVQLTDSTPEIYQLFGDYSLGVSDSWGKTNVYNHLVLSPGLGIGKNTDREFKKSRAESDNDYWYFRQTTDRTLQLPKDWSARATATWQYANEALPYSERMGLTGVNAVRGYYEDTLFTDSGVMLNLELATPNMNIPIAGKTGQLQLFLFHDWAKSYNKTSEQNSDLNHTGKQNIVSSSGLGLRFVMTPYVQFNGVLGWRERGLDQRGDPYLGHLSLVIGL